MKACLCKDDASGLGVRKVLVRNPRKSSYMRLLVCEKQLTHKIGTRTENMDKRERSELKDSSGKFKNGML